MILYTKMIFIRKNFVDAKNFIDANFFSQKKIHEKSINIELEPDFNRTDYITATANKWLEINLFESLAKTHWQDFGHVFFSFGIKHVVESDSFVYCRRITLPYLHNLCLTRTSIVDSDDVSVVFVSGLVVARCVTCAIALIVNHLTQR